MSPIPNATFTIKDGALGIAEANGRLHAKIGAAPFGKKATIYAIASLAALESLLGKLGPLPEASGHTLGNAGGALYCVPAELTTFGSIGSVTKVGTGVGTITTAAVPAREVKLKIITGGATATATFMTSIDGGKTYADLQTTASTPVQLANAQSIKVAFNNVSGATDFVAGDVWTLSTLGTTTRAGTGTGTLTLTCTPVDAYPVSIIITGTGGRGVGTFKYSIDGGLTYSGDNLIPSSGDFAIPNTGVKLTFSNSSFTKDDSHTFTTVAPSYSLTELAAAMAVLNADPRTWPFVHIVGAASSAANSAAMLTAMDSHMTTAELAHRFGWSIIEVPTDTDSNLISAFAAVNSTRVMKCASTATIQSKMGTHQLARSVGWLAATRAHATTEPVDMGRTEDGPIKGVVALTRDESATPGLDAAGFTTMRTIVGLSGFYITQGRMSAPSGSDFIYSQYRRIMDTFCSRVAQRVKAKYLNKELEVDKTTGKLTERQASDIENRERIHRDMLIRDY